MFAQCDPPRSYGESWWMGCLGNRKPNLNPQLWGSTLEDCAAASGLSSVVIDFTVRLCSCLAAGLLNVSMTRALGPILKTILFTILVPGSVLVLVRSEEHTSELQSLRH